jgi:ectoine hydroxylase-related dioxygenase (phytanoyl-CoA dioxygenase family)
VIAKEDIEQFDRDGAVCVRGAFSEEWLEVLGAGIEQNLAEPGPFAKYYTDANQPGFFFGDYCNWQRISQYRRFAFESPAADIAAAFMRSKRVNFFHEHVLVKEPRTEDRTPWHHDQPYWVVDGEQVCSIWMALDPVPEEVSVEFIRGSHRWGQWFTPKRFADHDEHPGAEGETIPDIDGHRDDYDIIRFALEPGDCIVFHALTVHGAPGNASPWLRRRAIATRWTGDDARFTRRVGFMSPPFEEVTLNTGDRMDSTTFPLVRGEPM